MYFHRFLHPESNVPYYKFGKKGAIVVGKALRTNGLAFTMSCKIGRIFASIIRVSQLIKLEVEAVIFNIQLLSNGIYIQKGITYFNESDCCYKGFLTLENAPYSRDKDLEPQMCPMLIQ